MRLAKVSGVSMTSRSEGNCAPVGKFTQFALAAGIARCGSVANGSATAFHNFRAPHVPNSPVREPFLQAKEGPRMLWEGTHL